MKLKKLNISTKLVLIILGFVCLVLIIGGWFYWFQWRPTEIRIKCNEEAKQAASELLKEKLAIGALYSLEAKKASEKGMYLRDDYNSLYERCLHEKGLR